MIVVLELVLLILFPVSLLLLSLSRMQVYLGQLLVELMVFGFLSSVVHMRLLHFSLPVLVHYGHSFQLSVELSHLFFLVKTLRIFLQGLAFTQIMPLSIQNFLFTRSNIQLPLQRFSNLVRHLLITCI